jgi:UDP-N-acetylglucosamine 2-epimerase (hydrolysing)
MGENRKKIALVFGTRPEINKMARLAHAIRSRGSDADLWLWNTGQHRDLVAPMLKSFELQADEDLGLMTQGQSPGAFFARALDGMARMLEARRPDWLVVQGDTSTAAAAGLAAFFAKVPVAHVEAGLRTFDLSAPWPEEYNRRLIAVGASWHFAPTELARTNLLNEGVDPSRVVVTGNTGIDALLWMVKRLRGAEGREFSFKWQRLDSARPLVLVTFHRREAFGSTMRGLMRAVLELVSGGKVQVVLPLHPNPEVRNAAAEIFRGELGNSLHIVDPLEYREFLWLMDRSSFLITDSGGVQEEAPSLGKPVIVAREKTERPEAVKAGAALLAGTDPALIVACARRLLEDSAFYSAMAKPRQVFGDGHASERIANVLLGDMGEQRRMNTASEGLLSLH